MESTKMIYGNFLSLSIDNPLTTGIGKSILYAHYEEKIMYITTLFTKPQYRGLKYASHLLDRAIYEAKKNKCESIKLMDCSRLFNKENNIYIKHGFTYDIKGNPEMTLTLIPNND